MTGDSWAPLVPELICDNLYNSLQFYCDLIGFEVRFERTEERFVYLDRAGAQIMLAEREADRWVTAVLARPFGRGVNLQIKVEAIRPIVGRLSAAGVPLFRTQTECWHRQGSIEYGQMEVAVQDPDGYLLRLVESVGTRPASNPEP